MVAIKRKPKGFWVDEVWPRRGRILNDRGVWLGCALALVFISVANTIPLGSTSIEDLANVALLYAALSFGAAVAGAGIALGVPGEERIQRWTTVKIDGTSFSSFENLIFAFAWSAMVQISVVIVAFLAFAFGTGYTVVPVGVSFFSAPIHYISTFLSFWLWWYAVFELSVVIRTFMAVARVITNENLNGLEQNPKSDRVVSSLKDPE